MVAWGVGDSCGWGNWGGNCAWTVFDGQGGSGGNGVGLAVDGKGGWCWAVLLRVSKVFTEQGTNEQERVYSQWSTQ